jgi:hypothetical protein
MNANRTRVEEALGVDLLYNHHQYASYVLVQYKRMRRESLENDGPVYRPTDESYKSETARMKSFLTEHGEVSAPGALGDYRLDP